MDNQKRTDHMQYMEGMEVINSDIMDKVISEMNSYDYSIYTEQDVKKALLKDNISPDDFKALLSPAALPLLEDIAQRAKLETRKHFGNSVYMFTPLYIANYCENYCIYCGFNCHNKIKRAILDADQIRAEMKTIAETGLQEVLILTGESRSKSDVKYIGEACKIASEYFKVVGLEVYPMNSDEYTSLVINAIAILSRRCQPPDKVPARLFLISSKEKSSIILFAFSRASFLSQP